MTENISTSTTENESEENHVNKKPQKKENIFIQIMKWLGFIILIAVIAFVIAGVLEVNYDCDGLGLIIAIIYFILSIALKASFKISFFWSAIIPIFFPLLIYLIIPFLGKIISVVWEAWGEWLDERERKREQERKIIEAKKQKQLALEQIQEEAAMEKKANEDAMRKSEVERNIDELSSYIDMLAKAIQKKELPDVQIVSELSKMLDSILNNKSYISKESFNKIRNDNEVFIKHILKKCPELENFSGTFLETRMQQVNAKFNNILG